MTWGWRINLEFWSEEEYTGGAQGKKISRALKKFRMVVKYDYQPCNNARMVMLHPD